MKPITVKTQLGNITMLSRKLTDNSEVFNIEISNDLGIITGYINAIDESDAYDRFDSLVSSSR